jgi:GAF domain-containing protein
VGVVARGVDANASALDLRGAAHRSDVERRHVDRRRVVGVERLQLVTSLAALLQDFLVDAQPSAFFSRLLRAVLDLTRSEYGFIAEVHHDAEGAPYMRSHALTDISWDDASRAAYAASRERGMEFRNLHTLFGAVLVTRDVVISNDPDNDPRAGGRPPGHVPMRAFLGLPVHRGGVMVGVVGIANRPGGYGRALCTFLDPVLATCGAAIIERSVWRHPRL